MSSLLIQLASQSARCPPPTPIVMDRISSSATLCFIRHGYITGSEGLRGICTVYVYHAQLTGVDPLPLRRGYQLCGPVDLRRGLRMFSPARLMTTSQRGSPDLLSSVHVIRSGPGCLETNLTSWPLVFSSCVRAVPMNPVPPPDGRAQTVYSGGRRQVI